MDIVQILIDNGAISGIYGGCESGSALSAAAHKGYLDIMKLLLDIGAILYEGILPHTLRGSRDRIIESNDAKSLPDETTDRHTEEDFDVINIKMKILAEDEKSYEDVIQPSIDTYDQRAVDQRRKIALYRAASFSDAEIAKFMLDRDERGATINLKNNDWGETALFRAT